MSADEGARPSVKGRCPNCGRLELFLAEGGHVTCSAAECDDPGMADDLLAYAQRWGDRVRLVRDAATPRAQGASEAAAAGDEPWLPMPVERAIERLDRSTAADTISEHRHAVITLQNFARHHLADGHEGTCRA